MTESEPTSLMPNPMRRRRRAGLRSLGIASAAAFAGGVAVVGVQFGLGFVSAGYPPVVQSLSCGAAGEPARPELRLTEQGGPATPVILLPLDTMLECRIDAPGADYAIWRIAGPLSGMRSGPIDPTLPCQSPEDFADQPPGNLRLSNCLRLRVSQAGVYLLTVQVMARGQQAVDRAMLAIRIPTPAPSVDVDATPPVTRILATLRLPASSIEQMREADLSASFSEHGLLPQSRGFVRTVYRLEPNEEFVSASFRARSAANSSDVRVAYQPQSRSVTASFTLRSGPVIDRWRGWVSGVVAVRVRRTEAPREIALPEASLPVPGKVGLALPEGAETADAHILLRRPETTSVADLTAGQSTVLDGARITARFEEATLVLEAARP